MSKVRYNFQRVEKKYLLEQNQYDIFYNRIKNKMNSDAYGIYSIYNIYFDTDNYQLIRESIEKPDFKEKLRLRSYGMPKENDTVFLEIKRKYNGIVYKRRAALSYSQAMEYLNSNKDNADNQIFKEIDYFFKFYKLKPKVFLSYDRTALYCIEDEALRITFDTGIKSRDYDVDLTKKNSGENLLESGQVLMEIKSEKAMPLWLVEILSELKIYPNSFSKYGKAYEKIQKNLKEVV